MKKVCTIFLMLAFFCAEGQEEDLASIDARVKNIDAPTPDSLARLLTGPYQTELGKARAIYSWIAQHIAYNTSILAPRRTNLPLFTQSPSDTLTVWKSADEMSALRVLHRRVAVCDGYARLFKILCDYAGLKSRLIVGFARGYSSSESRFRTNHTWNAVQIDSAWRLVDVTWGSGFVTYSNQFVQSMEERYFLADPRQFIYDHYPEDISWTLLPYPPDFSEFRKTPFRSQAFVKYSIQSYWPLKGIIEAAIGDTVEIRLTVKDARKDHSVSPDPFFDSTIMERNPSFYYLPAQEKKGTEFRYRYIVQSAEGGWINILYNDDEVLRYRLIVKEPQELTIKSN